MQARAITVGLHLLGWILFFGLLLAFVGYPSGDGIFSILAQPGFLFFVLIFTVLFYFNLLVLAPRLLLRKNYLPYFGLTAVLFLSVAFLSPFDKVMQTRNRHDEHRPPPPPKMQSSDSPRFQRPGGGPGPVHVDITSIILFVAVWSSSSVIQVLQQWRRTERIAAQAEQDKIAAELSFLKAHINPHFLFNTLNNIYSLAIVKSDRTPDAVLKLSNIMRYITDDVRSDFVPLQSEVACATDYIALQKLRLSDKVQVDYTVAGAIEEKLIPPLLFMTFIENAFKYGVSNHEDCIIRIAINAGQDATQLICENRMVTKNVEDREGVGISNAHKRLKYLYPDRHRLKIETANEIFTVQLSLLK